MRNFILLMMISGLFVVTGCGGNTQHSLQSEAVTQKYFPNPDIQINTPAFQKKQGFTNYAELMDFLKKIIATHEDVVKIAFIGKTVTGKPIPILYIGKGDTAKKVRIWLQGGLHGNEPAGTEALLYFIQQLLQNKNADSVFNRISLAIVPMANIDGYDAQTRYNQNKVDLNRDQTRLSQPESVALKKAFSDFSPHFAADLHEYRPFRAALKKFPVKYLCIPYDVLFLPSGNLNVPDSLRSYTRNEWVQKTMDFLSDKGYSSAYYYVPAVIKGKPVLKMGGSSPRSSASSFALSNAVSVLCEIRGINLGRTSFKRRVYTGYLLAKHFMDIAYTNGSFLKEVTNYAITQTKDGKQSVVLAYKPEVTYRQMPFINTENLEEVELQTEIRDANHSTAVFMRPRPGAYLILPDYSKLAQKLTLLGLKVEKLTAQETLTVTGYKITQYDTTNLKDRFATAEVTTRLEGENIEFPAGSFVVWLKQKNANLAVSVLEPEAPNGFVNYGVLKVETGETLPVYRYSGTKKLTTNMFIY